MNLCRTVGRKEARFKGVAATADRVRYGEAYGSRPLPPQVSGRHRQKTSRRGAGRGYKAGGPKGQAAAIRGTSDREAGHPPCHWMLRLSRPLMRDPGLLFNDAKAIDDKGP